MPIRRSVRLPSLPRSLPKFGTAVNRRGVPFAVIREAIRALNSQEHPAASNDIATGRAGELLFWKLVRENSELVDLRRFGKQLAGLGFFHQRLRHLAVEIRVPPALVVD